jgi:hypothetical protein
MCDVWLKGILNYFPKTNSTHHINKVRTSVNYIVIIMTEQETYWGCHACWAVHLMFGCTQVQQHQTARNACSCHSFLWFGFHCIQMQFTLISPVGSNSGKRWKYLSRTIKVLKSFSEKAASP